MDETQREVMETHIQELEQQLQRLHSSTSAPGPSSSTMDSVESTAAAAEAGCKGDLDRADSPTLEEWIELIESHGKGKSKLCA